jgi:hypothetical protein
MWVIHRGDRSSLYNIGHAQKLRVENNNIMIVHELYGNTSCLTFETPDDAKQAFGYLMDAIKRKDAMVSL